MRLFKALTLVLALVLLSVAGLYVYKVRMMQPVSVVVDGQPIAVAASTSSVTAALSAAAQSLTPGFGSSNSPQVVNRITYNRIPESQTAQIDADSTLRAKLASSIQVTVKAAVITVDKTPIVGLPNESLANQTLDAIKQHYAQLPPDDPIDGEPSFRQNVSVVNMRIPANLAHATVADAFNILVTPPPPTTYTVQLGETGWRIAHKFHMKFRKFLDCNEGRNIDKLKAGDTVNLSGGAPPISVIVVKRSEKEEQIRPGSAPSAAGRRRLETETTYVNGHQVGPPVTLGITTLQRATPARSVL